MSTFLEGGFPDWLVSGNKDLSHRALFNNTPMGSADGMFRRAIIFEVLYDLASFEKDYFDQLIKRTTNHVFLPSAPAGSVLVKIVDDADAKSDPDLMLCYPFFPPHIRFPVKPGEQVWVFDPTPTMINDLAYWVVRVTGPDFVDDINFTHLDRQLAESPRPMFPATRPASPGFPNGDPSSPSETTLAEENEYEQIYTGSIAITNACTFEAVPRFKSSPGDLAFQGSNNTLICLGQDRGYTSSKKAKSDKATRAPTGNRSNASMSPTDFEVSGRGTIDIVAGRGQAAGTKPKEIINSRGFKETNKNPINFGEEKSTAGAKPQDESELPEDQNSLINPAEGDPDFISDLSRVYISMRTAGDPDYNLSPLYPLWAGKGIEEPSPYVIAKSDEVRVVARNSVRMISETGNSLITILPDDRVAIHSKKILIGDGSLSQTYIGIPATGKGQNTSPLVLGDICQKQLDRTHSEHRVHAFKQAFANPIGLLWGWSILPITWHPDIPKLWVEHADNLAIIKSDNPTIRSTVGFINPTKHEPSAPVDVFKL